MSFSSSACFMLVQCLIFCSSETPGRVELAEASLACAAAAISAREGGALAELTVGERGLVGGGELMVMPSKVRRDVVVLVVVSSDLARQGEGVVRARTH